VFDSMDELPEVNWDPDQQLENYFPQEKDFVKKEFGPQVIEEGPRRWFERMSKTKKAVFISTLTIFGLLFFFLFFPSVTINVSPTRIKETMEFEVFPTTGDFGEKETRQLPLETVIFKLTGALTDGTSGVSHVPISRAEGSVIFTNLTAQQIAIPANTIVRTSAEGGTRYRTTRPAHLPDELGAEVAVPIEALTLGRSGNVPLNAISFIEGSLGLFVNVTNPSPLKGGSDEVRGMVTEEDLQQIVQRLMEELKHQAELEMKDSISSDRILVERSIESRKIYESHFSHLEGDIADTVSLELTLEFVAQSLSKHDTQIAATQSLSDDLPHGVQIVQDSMVFESAKYFSSSETEDKRILITIQIDTYQSLDFESIKAVIRGRRPSDAFRLLFEHIDLAFAPEMQMKPDWFPILPLLNERIELRCDGEKPG